MQCINHYEAGRCSNSAGHGRNGNYCKQCAKTNPANRCKAAGCPNEVGHVSGYCADHTVAPPMPPTKEEQEEREKHMPPGAAECPDHGPITFMHDEDEAPTNARDRYLELSIAVFNLLTEVDDMVSQDPSGATWGDVAALQDAQRGLTKVVDIIRNAPAVRAPRELDIGIVGDGTEFRFDGVVESLITVSAGELVINIKAMHELRKRAEEADVVIGELKTERDKWKDEAMRSRKGINNLNGEIEIRDRELREIRSGLAAALDEVKANDGMRDALRKERDDLMIANRSVCDERDRFADRIVELEALDGDDRGAALNGD